MAKSSALTHYALLGAAARAEEIRSELAAIAREFPGLKRRGSAAAARRSEAVVAVRRRRKPMTSAQKAEVSKRMKRYWAARRNEKKG